MKVEVIRENPRFKLDISSDEFEFLLRLLGNHIVGEGRFRTISNGIFQALDNCNDSYRLNMSRASLETSNQSTAFVRLM